MSSSKVVLGVLAGAAAGAILGILYAPDSGAATRQKIGEKTTDVSDSIKEKFSDFVDSLSNKFSQAKEGAEDLYEKGKSKVKGAKEDAQNSFS